MCLGNSQDLTAVRSGLLQELRSTFVCEDIVDDMRTFGKLGPKTMDEIKSIALKKDVVLSVQPRGGFFVFFLIICFTLKTAMNCCYH